MATQYAFGKIVTDGLVLALDAADRNSYVSGSATWIDLSGNGNSGTLVNGPTFSTQVGGAIIFDGTDDSTSFSYVQPQYTSTVNFTWNIWVYPTRNNNADILMGNRFSATTQFVKLTTNNFEYYNASGTQLTIGGVTPVNTWMNISVVKDGSNFTYYRNSSVIATGTSNNTIPSQPFKVGGDSQQSEYSNSRISIVYVYNRALSAAEVLQNYNATKTRFGL
jgi:hypothetical protein